MSAIDQLRVAMDRCQTKVVVAGVEMYFTPLTYADVANAAARNPGSDEEKNLYLLILKAKDAEGKPLFSWADLPILKTQVPATRLNEAMMAMYGASITQEDAEAELRKTPASTSD